MNDEKAPTVSIMQITRTGPYRLEVVVQRDKDLITYAFTFDEAAVVRSVTCDRDLLTDFPPREFGVLRNFQELVWRAYDEEEIPLPVAISPIWTPRWTSG